MISLLIALWLAIVWPVSALLITGWCFANFQDSFPSHLAKAFRREDLAFGLLFGLILGATGPIGVLITYFLSGFARYGWRLRGEGAKAWLYLKEPTS